MKLPTSKPRQRLQAAVGVLILGTIAGLLGVKDEITDLWFEQTTLRCYIAANVTPHVRASAAEWSAPAGRHVRDALRTAPRWLSSRRVSSGWARRTARASEVSIRAASRTSSGARGRQGRDHVGRLGGLCRDAGMRRGANQRCQLRNMGSGKGLRGLALPQGQGQDRQALLKGKFDGRSTSDGGFKKGRHPVTDVHGIRRRPTWLG